jgi:glycosyltransferase involved in cell wall biosynthesis
MESRFFDVVIPYYNSLEYLKLALDSVIKQEYKFFNLFVLDDNSPDNGAETHILNLNDTRIKYIKNSNRLGLPRNFEQARNTGESTWVVFLGQDDVLLPNYLTEMNKVITEYSNVVLIQGATEVIDQNGLPSTNLVDFTKKRISNQLKKTSQSMQNMNLISNQNGLTAMFIGNFFYFPTILWNRAIISQHSFRLDLEINLDLDMLIKVLFSGQYFAITKKEVAKYRRHSQSESSKKSGMFQRLMEERTYLNSFARENLSSLTKSQLFLVKLKISNSVFCLYMSFQAFRSRELKNAKKFFVLCFS